MSELNLAGSRKDRKDATGLALQRNKMVLELVTNQMDIGATVSLATHQLHILEGQATSALAYLHRTGQIVRLKERSSGQELYVLPEHVNGRKLSPFRERPDERVHPKFHSDRTVLEAMAVAGLQPEQYTTIRTFLEALP